MNERGFDIMSKNFIDLLIYESESYTDLNKMEQLVENGGDLSVLPLQPTFLALKSLPVDKIASYLPRFSKEQRQAFIDLDFWQKDLVDVENFQTWLLAYEHCLDDDVKSEFVESDSLLLFLKASFNIYTFDIEDLENDIYIYIRDLLRNKNIGSMMTFTTNIYLANDEVFNVIKNSATTAKCYIIDKKTNNVNKYFDVSLQ